GTLKKNFYRDSCPEAESTIKTFIESNVDSNPELPAKLLRLHFHDCFVLGCEGSVLLNGTTDSPAEKDDLTNINLAGFDEIEQVKTEIKILCPEIVSCADILALAARDSVSLKLGSPLWEVLTGRRDIVSLG
ncbi:hypothetical protein GIB67_011411, partial [Kingdonia uniflora]